MSVKKTFKINIYAKVLYLFVVLLLAYAFLRLGFYWSNRSLFPDVDPASLLTMMLGGVKFDIAALIYINSLFILMQGVPFAFRYDRVYQKISKWVFMITNTIGVLLNMIDFGYYKFTLKRTTATIFEQFSHEENKFKLSLDFLVDYWYLLFVLVGSVLRSEEHTSELQSRENLVCRLLRA